MLAQARPRARACALFVWLFIAACADDGRPCYPGDYRSCTCGGGALGYQQCDAAGQGYGACDCSGAVPGGSCAGGGGALLGFMAECADNAQCESGLCHTYNAKGSHCTIPCATDVECPPPSPGCNSMGVCKAP